MMVGTGADDSVVVVSGAPPTLPVPSRWIKMAGLHDGKVVVNGTASINVTSTLDDASGGGGQGRLSSDRPAAPRPSPGPEG